MRVNHRIRSLTVVVTCSLTAGLLCCKQQAPKKAEARKVTAKGEVKALTAEDRRVGAMAVDLVAKEEGIPKETIRLDTVRPVEWRDSSLGCPQPDQAYLQVITPGHKITVRSGKRMFFVHEANGRGIICKPKKEVAAVGGVDQKLKLVWGEKAVEARQDLAKRIGVRPEDIKVVSAQSKVWPDSSLGCPQPKQKPVPGEVKGFVIGLKNGTQIYTYSTDLQRVFACPMITVD